MTIGKMEEINLKEFKTIFRQSKEWNEKREALIKKYNNKCFKCGGKEKLSVAHKDFEVPLNIGGIIFPFIVKESMLMTPKSVIFKNYVHYFQDKMPDEYFEEIFEGCPNCRNKVYARPRKNLKPLYRCGKCEFEFDNFVKCKKTLRNEYYNSMYQKPEMQEFIISIRNILKEIFIEWYKDVDNSCILICNSCHYKEHFNSSEFPEIHYDIDLTRYSDKISKKCGCSDKG